MALPDQERVAGTAEVISAGEAAQEFYGWHADNGHAPEHYGAGGVECGTCSEQFQPEAE